MTPRKYRNTEGKMLNASEKISMFNKNPWVCLVLSVTARSIVMASKSN